MDKKGGCGCAVSSYRATDSPIYNERTATTKEEKKRNEKKRFKRRKEDCLSAWRQHHLPRSFRFVIKVAERHTAAAAAASSVRIIWDGVTWLNSTRVSAAKMARCITISPSIVIVALSPWLLCSAQLLPSKWNGNWFANNWWCFTSPAPYSIRYLKKRRVKRIHLNLALSLSFSLV